jgi:cyanophycin synthetase
MAAAIDEIEDALDIEMPQDARLVLEDARRLTGSGLLWAHPGAVLDVFFQGFDPERVVALWQREARRVLDAIGWQDQEITRRLFEGGASLAISAPMDQLYSAIFAARTAWQFCACELLKTPGGEFPAMIGDLREVMAREANPALIVLIKAAAARDVSVLCDDDELSLGYGTGSMTWAIDDLPEPGRMDWNRLHDVPVALITGTNGKTTTTRLVFAIARAAGRVAGLTSTDFVQVGDDILERGDFSGPGGARMLLRDPRLEIAALEVARGGILRRGLPLRRARAALVTIVADDHLGQYGINTVAELAGVKFAVRRALGAGGVMVLNADDAFVVAEAARVPEEIWWFSLEARNPQIAAARAAATPCAWAAGYNVLNALGAICLARAMGLDNAAIRSGLGGFKSDPRNNPGRSNEFDVSGARVFVDFAHNPHSVAAVTRTMAAIPARRRFVMLSHAGDRSDRDIRSVTATALTFSPDFVIAAELPDYLRGRETGEVSALIADECQRQGLAPDRIITATSPADGVRKVLTRLQPGDLALLLALSDRDEIFGMLEAAGQL